MNENDRNLIGNKEKARIHIAKRELGLSEKAYRSLLGDMGVSSSTELNFDQYRGLMAFFERVSPVMRRGMSVKQALNGDPPPEKEKMLSKIMAIVMDLKLPFNYANGMAKKMFRLDFVRWCNDEQTFKILQALIVFQNRKKGKRTKKDGPTIPRSKSGSGSS